MHEASGVGTDFIEEELPWFESGMPLYEMQCIIANNQWNGSIYDREDTFKTIMKEGSEIEVPSIEIIRIGPMGD